MALVKCPECSAEVSEEAVCCPKCGFPSPGQPPMDGKIEMEVRKVYSQQGKIAAIKQYRTLVPGMGLKEAKDFVEAMEKRCPGLAESAPKGTGCGVGVIVAFVGCALLYWLLR